MDRHRKSYQFNYFLISSRWPSFRFTLRFSCERWRWEFIYRPPSQTKPWNFYSHVASSWNVSLNFNCHLSGEGIRLIDYRSRWNLFTEILTQQIEHSITNFWCNCVADLNLSALGNSFPFISKWFWSSDMSSLSVQMQFSLLYIVTPKMRLKWAEKQRHNVVGHRPSASPIEPL